MIWPLSETLRFIEPHLPRQLISPQAFYAVKTIGSLLPDAMSAYYLECRLGARSSRVDFLTCAFASTGGREILAGQNETVDLPDIVLRHSLWAPLRDFFTLWTEPKSSLYGQVPLIWLEFDNDSFSAQIPLPSLLFCLDPGYLERQTQSRQRSHLNTQPYPQFIDSAIGLLFGYPLPSQIKHRLTNCFDALPIDGRIIHLSVMLSRQPCVVKVNVSLPKDQLLTYLTRVGWPGARAEIENILTTFCSCIDTVRIDLSVGDTISGMIGVEFFSPPSFDDSRRQFLLDLCAEKGLCTPEKRDALSMWPGWTRERFCGDSILTRLRRFLDIKIVSHPEGPLEAKGYLGFMPIFSLF
jgi:hypothetical protein